MTQEQRREWFNRAVAEYRAAGGTRRPSFDVSEGAIREDTANNYIQVHLWEDVDTELFVAGFLNGRYVGGRCPS